MMIPLFYLTAAPDDPKKGITQPAIKRMCRRAGVTRISGNLYETARHFISVYTFHVLNCALASSEASSRKTISTKDIRYALSIHGRKVFGDE